MVPNNVSNKGTPARPKRRKFQHVLPSHRKQVLSEGGTAMLLRSIGLQIMSDYVPGFGEVCTVDDGDGETPVSSSDTASTRSDYRPSD